MTNTLATINEGNVAAVPDEISMWQVMQQQAETLVKSGMLPNQVKSPAAAIAIMQTGRELGLQPMQSFRSIHIINGTPTLSASIQASMVQKHCATHGGYLRQKELSKERCIVEYKRAEWPEPQTFEFSMEDAKLAGLHPAKDNWKKHPREMMYSRAVANACRMGWPELVSGIYDPSEIDTESNVVAQNTTMTITEVSPADDEPLDDNGARSKAMKHLHALARDRGLAHVDLHERAVDRFGVNSMTALTLDQLSELADEVADMPLVDVETGEIVAHDNNDSDSEVMQGELVTAPDRKLRDELAQMALGQSAATLDGDAGSVFKAAVNSLSGDQDYDKLMGLLVNIDSVEDRSTLAAVGKSLGKQEIPDAQVDLLRMAYRRRDEAMKAAV